MRFRWVFSSTGGVEGSDELSTDILVPLFEQQLVDCSEQNSGCNIGLMDSVFTEQHLVDCSKRTVAAKVVPSTPLSHSTCKSSFMEVSFAEAQLNAEILSSAHVVLITLLAVLELMFTTLKFSRSLRPC